MNLDHAYGPPVSVAQGEQVLRGALDAGYDFLDTATLYGGGKNEERLGALLGTMPAGQRQRFVLASKCGMAIIPVDGKPTRVIDGRPATLQRECDASLRRLRTEVIDLYYLHRWDKRVPIEDSVGALADLVRAGKIRAIGLSEVGAATLRRAHAVHPIAALQTEYSLWTRNPEIAVLQTCADLGVAFVAFSPVARAYLTDQFVQPADAQRMAERDIRRSMGRFQGEAWAHNLSLLPPLRALAAQAGCTTAQLALAWVLAQGAHVVAIPGTTQVAHMHDNLGAADLQLPAEVLRQAGELINQRTVRGERYDAQATSEVDTELFA
jgi:aryl-alcohol dehydrogenase-like predicted oxidoreductase